MKSPKWHASNDFLEGKDATDDFEDVGHSESAKELMENFCIGELDTSSTIIPELEISSKKEATNYSHMLVDLTAQYWAIPVAIVGISVVIGFLHLRKKWSCLIFALLAAGRKLLPQILNN